jgi:hypothetical protein
MAITRTQIAKQLLAQGGRTGFQGGGADMGKERGPETGREAGPVGGGKGIGGNGGNTNREQGIMRSIPQAITDVQRGTLSDPREKQDVFEQPSKLSFLDFIPGIGTIRRVASVFGPLDNKKFFEDRVVPSLLDKGRKVPTFENYMKNRMAGNIDAYGNRIDQDDDDNNIILPVDTTFAQAPSTEEQKPEDPQGLGGLRLAFRADGGRIGLQEGGIMPRLNQLGSGVSSAEQTLQEINQRLESAESSLGSGGERLPEISANEIPFSFDDNRRPPSLDKIAPGFKTGQPTAQLSGSIQNLQNQQDVVDLEQLYPNAGQNQISNFRPMRGGAEMMRLAGIPAASYADGGNVVGGEFDFESARQMYGLGKLVKKVTRTVKKIAKSPVGKAAIAAATIKFGGPLAAKAFPSTFGTAAKSPFLRAIGRGQFFGDTGIFSAGKDLLFGTDAGVRSTPGLLDKIGGKAGLGIIGVSALAGLLTPEQEDEAQALADNTGIDIEQARQSILRAGTRDDFRARAFRAEGGSMKEPVAKKTMPLLDLDGKEMDLRAEGGFVPIGRMEKADDVPARLSKNEFVFTADAVRNAGDGNVDKGAEVMYNMMKNLEAGGDVSEESQGLEGARRMFQTSKRLEEVL